MLRIDTSSTAKTYPRRHSMAGTSARPYPHRHRSPLRHPLRPKEISRPWPTPRCASAAEAGGGERLPLPFTAGHCDRHQAISISATNWMSCSRAQRPIASREGAGLVFFIVRGPMRSKLTEEAINIIDAAPSQGPLRIAEYAKALPPRAAGLRRVLLEDEEIGKAVERYREADFAALDAQARFRRLGWTAAYRDPWPRFSAASSFIWHPSFYRIDAIQPGPGAIHAAECFTSLCGVLVRVQAVPRVGLAARRCRGHATSSLRPHDVGPEPVGRQ